MTPVDLDEYLKREITQEEADERVAWFRRHCKLIAKHNKECPLPDDFIDYCKGRKWIGAVQPVPLEGTA
jgi:hypothetical protein